MLDFIVLGHIPATQLQITIAWLQYFSVILLLLYLIRLDLKLVHIRHRFIAETMPTAPRVRLIRRIGAALQAHIALGRINLARRLIGPSVR